MVPPVRLGADRTPSPVTSPAVSARLRVWLAVGAASLAAAGTTVGVTLATRTPTPKTAAASAKPRPGAPPLLLDLGVRTDPEAQALRRGSALYDRGRRTAARAIFAAHPSVEARVGAALAAWPSGFAALRELADANPRSALVQLELGLADFWRGDLAPARAAWRRAKTLAPDTLYAVRAGDFLHPELPIPDLPHFQPSFASPPEVAKLGPPAQLAFLRAQARTGGVRAKLLYGAALEKLYRPVSAEREFAAAARLAPDDAEAQVAAAVGLFDKDRPARAARETLPARGDGPLPPRAPAPLARPGPAGAGPVPARGRRGPALHARSRGLPVPATAAEGWVQRVGKMSRTAYGACR